MKIDQDSVVVITGASRGIGQEAAIAFGRRGCRIVLASRDAKRLEETATLIRKNGGEPLVIPTDVSNESECHQLIQKTLEAFQKVDVLINNAGYGHYAQISDISTFLLDNIFRTNLFGTIWCTQAVLPHMKERKKGHIVNVSTVISKRSLPYMTPYCMSKFAMNAFDEGLRLEVRTSGIDVSLVCPGLTKTDFQDNARFEGFQPPITNHNAMSAKRVGEIILKVVEKRRRRVFLTAGAKFMIAIQKLSPTLCDELLHLAFSKWRAKWQNT